MKLSLWVLGATLTTLSFVIITAAFGQPPDSLEAQTEERLMQRLTKELDKRTQAMEAEIHQLKIQNEDLRKENAALFNAQTIRTQEFDKLQESMIKAESAPPPTTTVPTYSDPKGPGSFLINDIKCRPSLSYLPENKTREADEAKTFCHELNPGLRVAFENLNASVTGGYTNIAGSPNMGASLPITETANGFYQVGIGYVQKPILRQLRGWLFEAPDGEPLKAVTEQGSAFEDFVINAVQLSAGIGYGRALTVKNDDQIETANSRPQYSASLTYGLDLERTLMHLWYRDSGDRPVDAGYRYAPGGDDFWHGQGRGQIK